jgi:glycosyltransferase involved in cell wall biosynthesis
MNDLSIIILTFNEEINIEKCLIEASKLTDNIYIVDSFSTDKTIDICKKYNCKIYQNIFINQAVQLNWALENIFFKTEWVLRLDSDEYFLPELISEMERRVEGLSDEITGIFFRRRVYFMGKWIKHGGYYPTIILRAWRNNKAVCENRWMDEHMRLLEGGSIIFKNDFVDDNKKNLHWWISKHNDYATREAIEQLNSVHSFLKSQVVESSIFGTQEQKKKWLKEKVYNFLPLGVKPFMYFIYRYIIRLGFLDGFRGFLFHILQGFWYRFLVDAKVYEIQKKAKKSNSSIKKIIEDEYGIKL